MAEMKSILVPLDPSEFTQAATLRACEIATYFKARVKGLTIVDIEGIEDEIRLPFRIELMDYPRKHEVELVRASREKLVASMNETDGNPVLNSARSYLEEHGLDRVGTELVEKSIIEAFQDFYIDWADLCVLGASSKSVVEKMLVGSFPRKLILDGHIPLFISP